MDYISTIVIDPFYRSVGMTYLPQRYVGSLVQRILEFHGWIDGLDAVYVFDQSVERVSFFVRPRMRHPGSRHDRRIRPRQNGMGQDAQHLNRRSQAIDCRLDLPITRPSPDGRYAPHSICLRWPGWHKIVTRPIPKGS
jgi:hypothetical protein